MKALEEICDLEQQIHALTKRSAELKLKLSYVDDTVIKTSAAAGAALAKVTHHRGNRRHMKRIADLVNITEYIETLKHLSTSKAGLEDAQRLLAQVESGKRAALRELKSVEAALATAKRNLSRYGQLVEFKQAE